MGIFSNFFNLKSNIETSQNEPNTTLYNLLSQPEYEFLDSAIMFVLEVEQASVSLLQRKFKLGCTRAERLIDQMEELGVVGPFAGSNSRTILMSMSNYLENRSEILSRIKYSEIELSSYEYMLNNIGSDESIGWDYTKIDPNRIISAIEHKVYRYCEMSSAYSTEEFFCVLDSFKRNCLSSKLPAEVVVIGLDEFIERCKVKIKNRDSINEVDKLEGHEFERWCADLLRSLGFSNVEVTKGSGDQGVDVLAEKDGIRYAFQCKNYSSPLGNTPVQEVAAGKDFYNCHIGVVITNNYFTSGAKQLAERVKVLLWDRDHLERMIEKSKKL